MVNEDLTNGCYVDFPPTNQYGEGSPSVPPCHTTFAGSLAPKKASASVAPTGHSISILMLLETYKVMA